MNELMESHEKCIDRTLYNIMFQYSVTEHNCHQCSILQ